jgi:hypothetical protein
MDITLGPVLAHVYRWGFWIRIFGRGVRVERDARLLFSERYGYTRALRIGRWSVRWLPVMP